MKKICPNCSKEFETDRTIKKFCSNDCYKINHKQNYIGNWYKNSRKKILANPELHQKIKDQQKEKQRKFRLEINKDSEKYKKLLERHREQNKKYFSKKNPRRKK
jgi:protein-arginine kinase activator protein McsA